MKKNISIQLKATFCLIVFTLNSLMGFSCAFHVDNDLFEYQQANLDIPENSAVDYTNDKKPHPLEVLNENPVQENCCKDNIARNLFLNKCYTHRAKTATNNHRINVIISFPTTFLYKRIPDYFQNHIIQLFHLPTTNIRLLIRSFQI